MRSLVMALVFAGVLLSSSPAWARQSFFAARMDMQSWSGTLVDARCKKADPTKTCEVAEDTEYFGLQTDDGKYVSFDSAGNLQISNALSKREKKTGAIRASVTGSMNGDIVTLKDIQLQ